MENIVIKRVWEADYYYQVSITAKNDSICATTAVYVDDRTILALAKGFEEFLEDFKSKNAEFVWKMPNARKSTPDIVFRVSLADQTGHVQVEIHMILGDTADTEKEERCRFFVHADLHTINSFGKRIALLNKLSVGQSVALFEE